MDLPTYVPAIQSQKPIINDVCQAFDDLACQMERLSSLLKSAHTDMADTITQMEDNRHLYDSWMLLQVGIEALDTYRDTLDAMHSKALDERAARSRKAVAA